MRQAESSASSSAGTEPAHGVARSNTHPPTALSKRVENQEEKSVALGVNSIRETSVSSKQGVLSPAFTRVAAPQLSKPSISEAAVGSLGIRYALGRAPPSQVQVKSLTVQMENR